MLGDFSKLCVVNDRKDNLKINKDLKLSNNIHLKIKIIEIYRTLYLKITEYIHSFKVLIGDFSKLSIR